MAIRFIRTAPIAPTCILPCPLPTVPLTITVPFTATVPGLGGVKGGPKLTLNAGCTDCAIAIDLFAKFTPYILSIGLPLCVVGCAAAIYTVVTDVAMIGIDTVDMVVGLANVPPDFPTPSDVDSITKKVKKLSVGDPSAKPPVPPDLLVMVQDCDCLLQIFFPCGLASFAKLIRDLLRLIAALLNCLGTLLGDILRIGLRADIMRKAPDLRIQEQGVCLGSIARSQLNRLNAEMDIVWAVFVAAGLLFAFVEKVADTLAPGQYPDIARFSSILASVTEFQGKCAGLQSADLNLVIPNCGELKGIAFDMRDDLNAVAELLDQFVSVLCP